MHFKILIFIFSLLATLCAEKDWAMVLVRETVSATNFWGHREWTVATIIKSSHGEVLGKTIRIPCIIGGRGDTIKVFRIPGTNQWNLTGHDLETGCK